MASRIAARSTTAGTPVKSCISTRAGRKAISSSVLPRLSEPLGDAFDVLARDRTAVLVAQQIFEQDFERIGQLGNAFEAVLLGRLEAEIAIGLVADLQRLATLEGVERRCGHW